jgi:hypothetical protein
MPAPTMNADEALAEAFLLSQNIGPVAYEPDGNVPPDFLVDQRIAVEVRRLNENAKVGSKIQGLESADIAIGKVIREVMDTVGPPPNGGQKYYVTYRFNRPLGAFKEIKSELRQFFEAVRTGSAASRITRLSSGTEIEVFPARHPGGNQFRPAIIVDNDSGGMVVQLLRDNIAHCVIEKTKKIEPYKAKYPEWWLVLIDHVVHALDPLDWKQFKDSGSISHSWDRILLIDSSRSNRFFEV